jgi:hypothetical protein
MADKIFAGDEDEQAPNAPALAALLDLDKKIEAEASCLPARSFVSRLLHLFGVWRTRSTLTLTTRPTSAASAGARGGPRSAATGTPRRWQAGVDRWGVSPRFGEQKAECGVRVALAPEGASPNCASQGGARRAATLKCKRRPMSLFSFCLGPLVLGPPRLPDCRENSDLAVSLRGRGVRERRKGLWLCSSLTTPATL